MSKVAEIIEIMSEFPESNSDIEKKSRKAAKEMIADGEKSGKFKNLTSEKRKELEKQFTKIFVSLY